MSDSPAVRVADLTKTYRLYDRPFDRVKDWALRTNRFHREVYALRGVTFDVPQGSALGIVGSNGAGKSTLLKILTGTTLCSSGTYEMNGKIAALLELGTGFYPGFTGMQNIFLNAQVMGFSRKEIEAKVDEIVEFSELGNFIHQPIRTYSSGMIMRLGFSVATAIDPDILIIDEILAVGDMHFQKRCIDRIMSFRERGKTILFCSHSLYHVEEICDHAIWIKDGEMKVHDKSRLVVHAYENFERGRRWNHGTLGPAHAFEETIPRGDNGKVSTTDDGEFRSRLELPEVLEVRVLDAITEEEVEEIKPLDNLLVEIDYEIPEDIKDCATGFALYRSDQIMVAGVSTNLSQVEIPHTQGRYRAKVYLPRQHLLQGDYSLVAYLADGRGLHIYHSKSLGKRFKIVQETRDVGVILMEHHWAVDDITPGREGAEDPDARNRVADG